MNSVSIKFESILKEELSSINEKIRGTTYLENLKYKLINKLNLNLNEIYTEEIIDKSFEYNIEDATKIINTKLLYCNSPKMLINSKLEKNILLICLNGTIKIDIEDTLTKKFINFKLMKNMGITLPIKTQCNVNFLKKTIVIEINEEDKLSDIEKLENNTI